MYAPSGLRGNKKPGSLSQNMTHAELLQQYKEVSNADIAALNEKSCKF
jgi:hypothetical protein